MAWQSRESRAVPEAELVFSTSEEVCELWNSHEIVRVIGERTMREFILLSPEDGKMEGQTGTLRVRLIPTRNSDQELVEMILNHSNNKSLEKYDQSFVSTCVASA